MRNLSTPLFEPIRPDPGTEQFINFWKIKLEQLSAEHILAWAVETYGNQVAFASSWSESDDIICSLFERFSCTLPVVSMIYHLLLPEIWPPLSPEEMRHETFDGRTASEELWARFRVENCCKRNKSTICQYPMWIVATRRDQDAAFRYLPVLSWNERFGVLRLAPFVRWSHEAIREKESSGSDSLQSVFGPEQPFQSTSVKTSEVGPCRAY